MNNREINSPLGACPPVGRVKSITMNFVNLSGHMKRKLYILFILYILTLSPVFSQTSDTSFKAYEQSIPGSSLKFKLVPVKGGSFTMGSPETEKGRDADEGPQKEFTISPYWMGIYEVT